MFKVPKSLKSIDVLGISVPIKIDQALCSQSGALGLYGEGVITLRSKYACPEDFINTLTHETMHAHCHIVGLQLDLQIEEVIATTTERVFNTVTKTLHALFTEESSK